MKKNRIAAGALALALGLGAVAPAVADEAKETKTEAKQYTGAELFLAKYNDQLKIVNDAKVAGEVAKAKISEAKNRDDAAVKRYEAALEAYKALHPVEFKKDSYVRSPQQVAEIALTNAEKALNRFIKTNDVSAEIDLNILQNGLQNGEKILVEAGNAAQLKEYLKGEFTKRKADGVSQDQLDGAVEQYVNELVRIANSVKPGSDTLLAYQELTAAQFERDAAKTNYDKVDNANSETVEKYDEELDELEVLAKKYNVTVQVGNDGVKIADKEVKPADKGYTVEDLKAAKERAVRTVDAANLLLKKFPETVKTVEKELKDLVAKQEKLIETAEKVLGKKAAFISTAYAAEEEVDIDALTKELNETSDQIDNLLEKNEEVNKEANEKAEKEEKKEEKKDEKVEEKAEEKAEKEEKKEEKKDEKVEEKAEEKAEKKEEAAKPAAKPAKKAGNNAKTGIAGVAGVAGILAAASVAYAASKRD